MLMPIGKMATDYAVKLQKQNLGHILTVMQHHLRFMEVSFLHYTERLQSFMALL